MWDVDRARAGSTPAPRAQDNNAATAEEFELTALDYFQIQRLNDWAWLRASRNSQGSSEANGLSLAAYTILGIVLKDDMDGRDAERHRQSGALGAPR